eukprot:6102442-Pyramimonas_sp.AAC.1
MSQFRLICVVERSVEGLRAVVSKGIRRAPRHGPVHVALRHHIPLIQRKLESDKEFLADLAIQLSKCQTLVMCIESLGMPHRATFQELWTSHPGDTRLLNGKYRKDLVNMIYRWDAPTQHSFNPAVFVDGVLMDDG